MEYQIRFPLRWEKLAAAVAYLAQQSLRDDRFGKPSWSSCSTTQTAPRTNASEPSPEPPTFVCPTALPDQWQVTKRRLEDLGIIRVVGENVSTTTRANGRCLAKTRQLMHSPKKTRHSWTNNCDDFGSSLLRPLRNILTKIWLGTLPIKERPMPYELSGIRRPGPPDDETRARATG